MKTFFSVPFQRIAMVALFIAFAVPALAQQRYDTLLRGPKLNAAMASALDGAIDQKGRRHNLQSLTGERGLILLFSRSFNW